MAKFRAPSSSVDSTAFRPGPSHVQSSKPAINAKTSHASRKLQNLREGSFRPRDYHAKSQCAAKAAFKRVQKREVIKNDWVHVYVGNIGPDVDENAIRVHFSGCGRVDSVTIRCCGGLAMTVKPPPPSYYKGRKVSQYAVLVFIDKKAVRKALRLNGSRLGDREITVSRSVSDLPEVLEKVQKRLADYRERQGFADSRRAKQSAVRSMKLEPTVLLDTDDAGVDRKAAKKGRRLNQVLGFTFPIGIVG
ncbi:hypothetical protein F5I97DRAFT_899070 [Phlebopus sp. FC_14]|nr:hypothetical protein F5I97DRAFT_899070 [Phlebopus sp. FC_14]